MLIDTEVEDEGVSGMNLSEELNHWTDTAHERRVPTSIKYKREHILVCPMIILKYDLSPLIWHTCVCVSLFDLSVWIGPAGLLLDDSFTCS